ncbi:MAG: hypothetical protein LBG43_08950 [Treponema sp.]|jgi:hypothetical protein|nr:hypothetical protein [Treponema sp.]
MSPAAQTAVNAAGRCGVICIGVDGASGSLSMIKSGELKAAFYRTILGRFSKPSLCLWTLLKEIREGWQIL